MYEYNTLNDGEVNCGKSHTSICDVNINSQLFLLFLANLQSTLQMEQ
jgi:hypothetical protein